MTDASPVIYGEVLFDVFPDGSRILGGAPFNVTWHCHAFGLNPFFISRIGDDEPGHEIISAMNNWGMDIRGIQYDPVHETGVVEVSFVNGEPDYDIVENSAWDFIEVPENPVVNKSLLYHGSLVTRNNISADSLAVLKSHFINSIFVDINLRSPWWSQLQIAQIIKSAQWIKLNENELSLIVPYEDNIINQARTLLNQYHAIFIIVTQGKKGALAINSSEVISVEPVLSSNVIDTVGAGDAFTSVVLLGLHKNWPLELTINRAQEFASKVVGLHGATTRDISFYKPFINNWSL